MATTKSKTRKAFKMPATTSIPGRSSSITAAFVTAILARIEPSDQEIARALKILEMEPSRVECAYCGGSVSEWDHLRPLVKDKKPTGQVTEIGNLVPSCGKCNQSKGNKPWRKWIDSSVPHAPRSRGVPDLEERIARLTTYEQWRPREAIDLKSIVGDELWAQHWRNRDDLLRKMRESQLTAKKLQKKITEKLS